VKRTLAVFLASILLFLLLAAPGYADPLKKSIEVTYNNIQLVVDGKRIVPQDVNGNIVEPFIYNGTTYLPVRAVSEALGKTVEWDGATQTVYVSDKKNTTIQEQPQEQAQEQIQEQPQEQTQEQIPEQTQQQQPPQQQPPQQQPPQQQPPQQETVTQPPPESGNTEKPGAITPTEPADIIVYVSNTDKIHTVSNCSGMKNYREMTLTEARKISSATYCTKCAAHLQD